MDAREKRLAVPIVILVSLMITFGCGRTAGLHRYSLDDEDLLPYAAMHQVDRERLCLTEIDPDSRVRIERDSSASGGYDVLLHLRGSQADRRGGREADRVIAFVWEDGEYVWIGEMEIHCSGRTFTSPDGEIPECITIVYDKGEFDLGTPAGLSIWYEGENAPSWPLLTCEQALSLIRSWDAERTVPGDN